MVQHVITTRKLELLKIMIYKILFDILIILLNCK